MRYFSTPGAGVATREDPDWLPPAGWRKISKDQYDERRAVIDERIALHVAGVASDIEAERAEDYADLIALGVPERLAQKLTGHKVANRG